MYRARIVVIVALAGCGRFGFDGDGDAEDAPATSCPPFASVCDDFESGALASWWRPYKDVSSTLQVQPAVGRDATFALDARQAMQSGTGGATMAVHDQPMQTSGTLSVRAWLYAPTALTNFEGALMLLDTDAVNQYAEVVCSDANDFTIAEGSPGGGSASHHSGVTCAGATWQCVELVYELSPMPRLQLYVDDVMVLDRPTADPAPSFGEIGVGVSRGNTDPVRVIADDVIIADRRIGC